VSFHEIAISITAINRASHHFERIKADAKTMEAEIRSVGATIAGFGATGVAVVHLAHSFGLVNNETSRWASTIFYTVTVLGAFLRTSWGVAAAQKLYAWLTGTATAVTWGFNAALAMKVALLTLGVGLVIATAAYMAWLASTTREAASAQAEYNAELEKTHRRSIRRAGEEEALRRRGVE